MPEIGKDGLHSKKGGEATTPRKSSKGAGPGSTKNENEDKTTKAIEVKKNKNLVHFLVNIACKDY